MQLFEIIANYHKADTHANRAKTKLTTSKTKIEEMSIRTLRLNRISKYCKEVFTVFLYLFIRMHTFKAGLTPKPYTVATWLPAACDYWLPPGLPRSMPPGAIVAACRWPISSTTSCFSFRINLETNILFEQKSINCIVIKLFFQIFSQHRTSIRGIFYFTQ